MNINKKFKYLYFIALNILTLGIFYWLNHLSDGHIKMLLDFYKNSVEIFFGNSHYYNESAGYYVGNNYIIGKNCLGLNIIVLIFGVCSFAGVGRLKGYKNILSILLRVILSVVVGILANILRLLSSIYFTALVRFEFIHALLGIIIYLSAAIFCYVFSKKMLINNTGGGNVEKHI